MPRKLFALALVLIACPLFARTRAVSHPTELRSDAGTVSGTVSSVQGTLIQIAGGTIKIDASQARVVVGRGQEATAADIKPGMQIFASLRASNPNSEAIVQATLITATDPADASLSGQVQNVDAAGRSFTLLGIVIRVDDNTSYGSYRREATTSFADIQPNVIVHVQADNVGGHLVAREVLVVAPAPPQVGHLRGIVHAIGADSWTIRVDDQMFTIYVNAQTRIAGSPKAGDVVDVIYTIDSSNRSVAVSIIKFDPTPAPMVRHFQGRVKTIGTASWVITVNGEDKTFAVNQSTSIMPGITVNDPVDVLALVKDDGTMTAVAIVRLPRL